MADFDGVIDFDDAGITFDHSGAISTGPCDFDSINVAFDDPTTGFDCTPVIPPVVIPETPIRAAGGRLDLAPRGPVLVPDDRLTRARREDEEWLILL